MSNIEDDIKNIKELIQASKVFEQYEGNKYYKSMENILAEYEQDKKKIKKLEEEIENKENKIWQLKETVQDLENECISLHELIDEEM